MELKSYIPNLLSHQFQVGRYLWLLGFTVIIEYWFQLLSWFCYTWIVY